MEGSDLGDKEEELRYEFLFPFHKKAHEPHTRIVVDVEFDSQQSNSQQTPRSQFTEIADNINDSSSNLGEAYGALDLKMKEQHKLYSTVVPDIWGEQNTSRGLRKCLKKIKCESQRNKDHEIIRNFSEMSDQQKKYRIKYLWFKVRCVKNIMGFIITMRNIKEENDHEN